MLNELHEPFSKYNKSHSHENSVQAMDSALWNEIDKFSQEIAKRNLQVIIATPKLFQHSTSKIEMTKGRTQ